MLKTQFCCTFSAVILYVSGKVHARPIWKECFSLLMGSALAYSFNSLRGFHCKLFIALSEFSDIFHDQFSAAVARPNERGITYMTGKSSYRDADVLPMTYRKKVNDTEELSQ